MEQVHIANTEPSIIYQIRTVKQGIDKILSEEVEKICGLWNTDIMRWAPKPQNCSLEAQKKQLAENTICKIRDPPTN